MATHSNPSSDPAGPGRQEETGADAAPGLNPAVTRMDGLSIFVGSVGVLLLGLALVACGSDAGGGAISADPTPIQDPLLAELEADGQTWNKIERYDDGALKALGHLDDQGRPHGQWRWWYQEGGRWWEATYDAGSFDPAQPWTLYNADGSPRALSGDGAPPEVPPL